MGGSNLLLDPPVLFWGVQGPPGPPVADFMQGGQGFGHRGFGQGFGHARNARHETRFWAPETARTAQNYKS